GTQLGRSRKYLRPRKLSGPPSPIFRGEFDSCRFYTAASDERVVGILRRLGALLRTTHARARFSEIERAPLCHAQGPALARAQDHNRLQDAERPQVQYRS